MPEFQLVESAQPDPASGGDRKQYDPIPEDTIIEATLVSVDVRPHPFFKDDNGDAEMKVNFEFNFEYNGEKRKLWGETPTTFTTHPDCKLRNWVQQILGGGELPAGFKLNTDTLKDNKVRIVVGYRDWMSKDTPPVKKWRNEVKDVMHARSAHALLDGEEPF